MLSNFADMYTHEILCRDDSGLLIMIQLWIIKVKKKKKTN